MRFITLGCIFLEICLISSSCIVETSYTEPEAGISIANAVEATADQEFTPSDDDTKCFEDTDCDIVEKGCCFHEKPMALAKLRAFEIEQKIMAGCRKLKKDYWDEQKEELKKKHESWVNKKIDLCKGRTGSADWRGNIGTVCKKDKEEPKLKQFFKDFKNPVERTKKFYEARKEWLKTPGHCVLTGVSTKS